MKRIMMLGVLVSLTGCLNPVRTDSMLRVIGPVQANLVVELPSTSNDKPVVEMPVDGAPCDGKRIAIIDVDGLLLNTSFTGPYAAGDNPVDIFREKLDAAAGNHNCAAVVLRVNSPGGSVTATDVMWRELMAFKEKTHKPVVCSVMDLGCGGGYYLTTACDQIVAHPTSVLGGVGVVLNLFNFQGTMGLANVKNNSIKAKASPRIDLDYKAADFEGSENEQILVTLADELYDRFKTIVTQSRPTVKPGKDDPLDGRVFSASQALKIGLIDKVGYVADAVELARKLASAPDAGVVLLHRRGDVGRTPFATTANAPLQANLLPISIPSADRSKLPLFLYLWQPDPSMERMSGK